MAVAAALGQAEFCEPQMFDSVSHDHVARIESVEDFDKCTVAGARFDGRAEQIGSVDDVNEGAGGGAQAFRVIGERGGGNWNVKSRPRIDTAEKLQGQKLLW